MKNVYINMQKTLNNFQQVVERSDLNLPEKFDQEQRDAFELFKKRFFLERVVEETIAFNKKISFTKADKNLKLATTVEDLMEIFKLRSDVLTKINYQSQFPDTIEGLNFDSFDTNSAVIYYKTNDKISATMRIIFDSDTLLPSEKNFDLKELRTKYNLVGELSRLIVNNEAKGLGLEFKNLFKAAYYIFEENDIDVLISCIKVEHLKLYKKFGGTDIVTSTDKFASLGLPIHIMAWNPSMVSKFFHKAFLS